ncbi:MAG: hypothetical protein ACTTJ3_00730 [Treponema sp.]
MQRGKSSILYRVIYNFLFCLIFFLVILITTGTIIAFLREDESKQKIEPPLYLPHTLREGKAIYSEFKQLRIISSDKEPATIVLNPFLEYDAENIPLREEIVQKKELLKNIITSWFLQRSWYNIETQEESDIKNALLTEINDNLKMGCVSAIYFEEFKIVH